MKKRAFLAFVLILLVCVSLTACGKSSSTVTFDKCGGEGDAANIIVTHDKNYGMLPILTKTGYTFEGWYTEKDGQGEQITAESVVSITQDHTLYASWAANIYTISFDGCGGVGTAADKVVTYDGAYGELPSGFTKTGYTFNGWRTEAGLEITADSLVQIAQDHTLYANWTANQYIVWFDIDTGMEILPAIIVTYNDAYSSSGDFYMSVYTDNAGHTFAGWYTEDNGQGVRIHPTTVVTIAKDHILYPYWTANKYTISFDKCGGEGFAEDILVTYLGAYGELPSALTKTGYGFAGWYTEENGQGYKITAESSLRITSNQTLYANWTANKYTISFDKDGGAGTAADKTVTYDVTYGELPSGLTKTGYTFEGWYTEEGGQGNEITAESVVSITSNQTLYANWTANKYTISFDKDGGAGTAVDKVVTYDGVYGELPSGLTKTGYTFDGWYTEEDGQGNEITVESVVIITANQTLYAYWTANTYTVSFDKCGGAGTAADKTVTYDSTYGELPSALTKTGYTFKSWYTEEDGQGDEITAESGVSITANQTLYAYWTANKYTISFDKDGGVGTAADKTVTYDGTYGELPSALTKTGYEFAGWYTEEYGQGVEITVESVVSITANQTLYANWTANKYPISFDKCGGAGIAADKTVTYDSTYGELPSALTKSGYEFAGWYTEGDGQGEEITAESIVRITASQTLYAYWVEIDLDSMRGDLNRLHNALISIRNFTLRLSIHATRDGEEAQVTYDIYVTNNQISINLLDRGLDGEFEAKVVYLKNGNECYRFSYSSDTLEWDKTEITAEEFDEYYNDLISGTYHEVLDNTYYDYDESSNTHIGKTEFFDGTYFVEGTGTVKYEDEKLIFEHIYNGEDGVTEITRYIWESIGSTEAPEVPSVD